MRIGWSIHKNEGWRCLLALALLTGVAHASELSPNTVKIRALIAKLAITDTPASEGPIFSPSKDTPKTDERVIAYEAAEELSKFGLEAFPLLLASLADDRQSVAFRRSLPSTVGDACYCLITRQLYALPEDYSGSFYRHGADGELHARPVFSKDLFSYDNLKGWLASRQGRPLSELQLEALGWVLAEEELIGVATPEKETEYLAPLRAKHAALKKEIDSAKAKRP